MPSTILSARDIENVHTLIEFTFLQKQKECICGYI